MEIVEIEAPKFEELTKEKYNEIIDKFGSWKVETNKKLKENEDYIKKIEKDNADVWRKNNLLKDIINEIVERI